MSRRHTPGPWRILPFDGIPRGRLDLMIVGADFPGMGMVATVNGYRVPAIGARPDAHDNAALIADAPAMLDLIERAADVLADFAAEHDHYPPPALLAELRGMKEKHT